MSESRPWPTFLPYRLIKVAAFVDLGRHGSLRAAAETLHLTEQGVRNRLVSL